eukprot:gb/GECG01009089.1/.p1 GENE.gb/GECG01009089.1/~~gb/GECG01009089.1/.p1  ORF type:complete len:220 (+),score=19.98 gb/GECG01009089.1/:1-660(+)
MTDHSENEERRVTSTNSDCRSSCSTSLTGGSYTNNSLGSQHRLRSTGPVSELSKWLVKPVFKACQRSAQDTVLELHNALSDIPSGTDQHLYSSISRRRKYHHPKSGNVRRRRCVRGSRVPRRAWNRSFCYSGRNGRPPARKHLMASSRQRGIKRRRRYAGCPQQDLWKNAHFQQLWNSMPSTPYITLESILAEREEDSERMAGPVSNDDGDNMLFASCQ